MQKSMENLISPSNMVWIHDLTNLRTIKVKTWSWEAQQRPKVLKRWIKRGKRLQKIVVADTSQILLCYLGTVCSFPSAFKSKTRGNSIFNTIQYLISQTSTSRQQRWTRSPPNCAAANKKVIRPATKYSTRMLWISVTWETPFIKSLDVITTITITPCGMWQTGGSLDRSMTLQRMDGTREGTLKMTMMTGSPRRWKIPSIELRDGGALRISNVFCAKLYDIWSNS